MVREHRNKEGNAPRAEDRYAQSVPAVNVEYDPLNTLRKEKATMAAAAGFYVSQQDARVILKTLEYSRKKES